MKALEEFKREMRHELRSVRESVKFCGDACDETKLISFEVKALRKEVSELLKCSEGLRKANRRLTPEIDDLNNRAG